MIKKMPKISARPIQTGIGKGFLKHLFSGKPFMHCTVELVKNARDWGAGQIFIMTAIARHVLRIVDDGDGMNEANRNAFASINMTTARGPRQSGVYCTGTKQMLFSHATHVEVRTASSEEADTVYRFSFSTDEYESLVLKGETIEPERLEKNQETWPHPHRFGTEITYTLRDPQSRTILRGEHLAEELSARLPRKFGNIVTVDGKPLPPKKIVGQTFEAVEQVSLLGGEVAFEIYRPEKPGQDEELRLTGVEIGEVPMRNFNRVLGNLRVRVPEVYLLTEVCGTIAVPYFKDYSNEDRFTASAALADDPRTPHFIRLLEQLAPEVQRRLRIKLNSVEGTSSDDAVIEEIADLFNNRYNPKGERPDYPGTSCPPPDDPGAPPTPREKQAIQVECRREFEIDETITVTAKLRKDLAGSYRSDELKWYTDRSHAVKIKKTSGGLSMVASELGLGVVWVDLPGTPHSAAAHYDVVPERLFRLSTPWIEIKIGSQMPIMAVNMDKLGGDIRWELGPESVGTLEAHGGRVIYNATRTGRALVIASDSTDPKKRATCDVNVLGLTKRQVIRIRDQFFEYRHYEADAKDASDDSSAQPAFMLPRTSIHQLFFNTRGRGYQDAKKRGSLHDFLALVIALEFSRFSRFDLEGINPSDLDPRDLPKLLREMTVEGYKIFEEIIRDSGSRVRA